MAINAITNTTNTINYNQNLNSGAQTQTVNTTEDTTETTNSTYIDAKDLNQDGYVSASEEYLYDLMHNIETNETATYNAQGGMDTTGTDRPRVIDVTV